MARANKNSPQVVAAKKSPQNRHKQRTRVLERANPERVAAARAEYHRIVDPVGEKHRETMHQAQAELHAADLEGMAAYERILERGV